jgi:16S rRNA G966 N2-methylase RsmD
MAMRCIEENCHMLKVEKQSTFITLDCLMALKKLVKSNQQFDVVYVDPPYADAARLRLLEQILSFFDTSYLLNQGGTLFLEESAPPLLRPSDIALKTLRHIDTRVFSRSALHQFRMTKIQK